MPRNVSPFAVASRYGSTAGAAAVLAAAAFVTPLGPSDPFPPGSSVRYAPDGPDRVWTVVGKFEYGRYSICLGGLKGPLMIAEAAELTPARTGAVPEGSASGRSQPSQ